jgi:hypothetical protein
MDKAHLIGEGMKNVAMDALERASPSANSPKQLLRRNLCRKRQIDIFKNVRNLPPLKILVHPRNTSFQLGDRPRTSRVCIRGKNEQSRHEIA